jgi:Acetyltransferase (GNAT) domain
MTATSAQLVRCDGNVETWKRVCATSEGATFFHTDVWAGVIARTFPHWTPAPVSLEFADGNEMVMPLMKRRGLIPAQHYYESMPPGVYGGPIFSHTPSEPQLEETLGTLRRFPSIVVQGNPFVEVRFAEAHQRELHTHMLDLRPGDRIEKRFRKGHLANISAARRKGVQVTIASTAAEIDDYFAVYQNSLARWGENASGFYPRQLFQNLFALPEYGGSVKLWLASYDNKIVAGAWIFYHRHHAVYWHGAMHADYAQLHPVHLMLVEAIKAARAEGFHWFDFNPSGGLAGVEHFKRGFGAEPVPVLSYRRLSPLGKAYRAKRFFQETVLRSCPV